MKLHLPKGLRTALLACLSVVASAVATSFVFLSLGAAAFAAQSGGVFYINVPETWTNDSTAMKGYAEFDLDQGVYTFLNTDPTKADTGSSEDPTPVTKIVPGDSVSGTISVLNVAYGKSLSFEGNNGKAFSNLELSDVKVFTEGEESSPATFYVNGSHVITLGGVAGVLNFDFAGGSANYERRLNIKDGEAVPLGYIHSSWGLDAVDVGAGATLNVSDISFLTGDNTSGDRQGAKLTGAGSVEVMQFRAGNDGNYTVSVNSFQAATVWSSLGANRVLKFSSAAAEVTNLYSYNSPLSVTNGATLTLKSGGQDIFCPISNEGTLIVESGAEITVLNSLLEFDDSKQAGRDATLGSGFGLLKNLEDTDIAALKAAATTGGGTVVWKGTQTWGCQDSYFIYDSVTERDLDLLIKAGKSVYVGPDVGEVKLTTSNVMSGINVTVCKGSTWNINGKDDTLYTVTLDGGTLTNTGAATNAEHKQIEGLALTANSVVSGSSESDYYLIAGGYAATSIDLGGFTLTKKGECNFNAVNTTIFGGGWLKIEEGSVYSGHWKSNSKPCILGIDGDVADTNVWLAGGRLEGVGLKLGHNAEIKVGSETVESSDDTGTTYKEIVAELTIPIDIGTNRLTLSTMHENDSLSVKGTISGRGEIAVSGKNVELVSGSTSVGKLSVLAGGNLTVADEVTLGSTIENAGTFTLDGANGGKLTFTSKDDLTPGGPDDVVYRDPTQSETEMTPTDNGYAEGTFIIIKNETGASATGITEIYITGDPNPYTEIVSAENGVKILGDKAMKGLYYVNSGTFKYGETIDGNPANAAASDATTGVVLNGEKLIMLTGLNKMAANQDGIILV